MQTASERIELISTWERKDILKCCRAAGITAHSIKDNRQLAEMLVRSIDKAKAQLARKAAR